MKSAISQSSTFLDALGEAALIVDLESRIVSLNRTAELLYAVVPERVIGRPLTELIGTDTSMDGLAMRENWQTVLHGEVWRGVVWHKTAHGKRFRAEVSVRTAPDEDTNHLLAIVRDVTEREAERIRQTILSDTLRALAEAGTPEASRTAALEGLTGLDRADAVLLNTRDHRDSRFRLSASRGLGQASVELVRTVELTAAELVALEAGEVLQYRLPGDASGPATRHLADEGFRWMVAVGKRSAGELIGTLVLLYHGQPELDLAPILPNLGAALGTQLSLTRSLELSKTKARDFARLAELSSDLEMLEEPSDIAQHSLETFLGLTGLEGAVYARLSQGQVWVVASHGRFPEDFLREYHGSTALDWGGPLISQAFQRAGVFVTSDAQTVPEFAAGPARVGLRSIVMAPVSVGQSVRGYVAAASFAAPHDFTEGTSDIARFVAGRIGRALERSQQLSDLRSSQASIQEARRHAEERARAFAKLAELSGTLETLDEPHGIAKHGLETLLALTGLDGGVYYEHADGQFSTAVMSGRYPDALERLIAAPQPVERYALLREVADSGRPRLVLDYSERTQAVPTLNQLDLRTVLFAPILLGGRLHGFLGAASFGEIKTPPDGTLEFVGFLAARIARALERAETTTEIFSTRAATFQALGRALEARDFETKGHTDRVVRLSLELGRAFRLDKAMLESLEWGAYVHDIGKIAIPDRILLKPGPLDAEEWAIIRQHPVIGYRILEDLHFLPLETLRLVRYHQERVDGSGYPDGLYGAEIPFLARLFAVVDVYDALTSKRPYKEAWSLEATITELRRQAAVKLDSEVVDRFLEIIQKRPELR